MGVDPRPLPVKVGRLRRTRVHGVIMPNETPARDRQRDNPAVSRCRWPTGHRSRVHASGLLAGSLVPSSIVPMARSSSSSGYFSAQAYVVVHPVWFPSNPVRDSFVTCTLRT